MASRRLRASKTWRGGGITEWGTVIHLPRTAPTDPQKDYHKIRDESKSRWVMDVLLLFAGAMKRREFRLRPATKRGHIFNFLAKNVCLCSRSQAALKRFGTPARAVYLSIPFQPHLTRHRQKKRIVLIRVATTTQQFQHCHTLRS